MEQPNNNEKTRRTTGIPKGVYRFKTVEESDEWMNKMLARHNQSKADSSDAGQTSEKPPQSRIGADSGAD
jgi:hypothetical protein